MSSITPNALVHDTYAKTNNYFLDYLLSANDREAIKMSPVYRFALDIMAKTNADYQKYLTDGDMRLRIVSYNPNGSAFAGAGALWLGDMSGAPVAKVYMDKEDNYCFMVGRDIKERGSDRNVLHSKKTSVILRSLFSMHMHNRPKLLNAMREMWEAHTYLIDNNISYAASRVLSENNCKKPNDTVTVTREIAKFLLSQYADPQSALPPMEMTAHINAVWDTMKKDEGFYERAVELAMDVFDCERWVVIQSEPGHYIGSIRTSYKCVLDPHNSITDTHIVKPFVFVRKFDELANISPDLHEQFMGAYTMVKVAEPQMSTMATAFNLGTIPYVDWFFKKTGACAYYRSQAMDGGVSFSFRALSVGE